MLTVADTSNAEAAIEDSWRDIDTLTASMHETMRQQYWEALIELAAARHRKIVAHFKRFPVGPATSGFYRQHLTALLQHEAQMKEIVVAARREIMREGLSLNHNRRAVGAYAVNQQK